MPTKALPSIFEHSKTINDRVKRYLDGKHKMLTADMQIIIPGGEETKWAWYSKKQVQTWLEEMELLNGDGLRIYFGEKEVETGDETNLAANIQKAAGQLCLIMVLTRQGIEEDSHVNIIYEKLPDFKERELLYDAERAAENSDETEQTMNFNFGSYSPPKTITEGDDFPNDSVT
jgi:hypothetical protein